MTPVNGSLIDALTPSNHVDHGSSCSKNREGHTVDCLGVNGKFYFFEVFEVDGSLLCLCAFIHVQAEDSIASFNNHFVRVGTGGLAVSVFELVVVVVARVDGPVDDTLD